MIRTPTDRIPVQAPNRHRLQVLRIHQVQNLSASRKHRTQPPLYSPKQLQEISVARSVNPARTEDHGVHTVLLMNDSLAPELRPAVGVHRTLRARLAELEVIISELRKILESEEIQLQVMLDELADVVKKYSDAELSAVVDYMSRLEWPERQKKE